MKRNAQLILALLKSALISAVAEAASIAIVQPN